MQDNPYLATMVGALRYLVESGLWPFFLAFVIMIATGCRLARRPEKEFRFWG
jgi:hypothetical protein